MERWLGPVLLAVFGVLAVVVGVSVWRTAADVVTDARRTLQGMFGEQFPGLFQGEPDPRSARIGGVAFVVLGVLLVLAGALLALLSTPLAP